MKNRLLIFTTTGLFCSILNLSSQISSRTVAEKPAEPVPLFDSITDKVDRDYSKRLAGQEIFIVPASKAYEEKEGVKTTGYHHFYDTNGSDQIFVYKAVPYAPGVRDLVSSYKSMNGKYFKIMEVIDQSDEKIYSRYESGGKTGIFLKLQGKQTGEICYYHFFTTQWVITRPNHEEFIFTGNYEKAKKNYLNKKFMSRTKSGYEKTLELNTGHTIDYSGLQWTCTDVSLVDRPNREFQVMALIFKDSASHEIAVFLDEDISGSRLLITDFKSEDERLAEINAANEREKKDVQAYKLRKAEMTKKYGAKFGPKVADREVMIGMNKKMCVDAWGEPDHINVTSTNKTGDHEQWVYNLRSYIYFDNNILTAIQSTQY